MHNHLLAKRAIDKKSIINQIFSIKMKFPICIFILMAYFACGSADPEILVPATVANGLHAIPNYKSSYSVVDVLTGDKKSVQETRVGDVTKGSYSFVQPDGVVRTVVYTSTPITGFQAQVLNSGPSVHSAKAKSIATLVTAPLIVSEIASPLGVVVPSQVEVALVSPLRAQPIGIPVPVAARLASSNLIAPVATVSRSPGRPVASPVANRFITSNLAIGDPRVAIVG